ncbi:MAG: major facilitator superfamily 1 [Caulobacter sp.]|nr:major facilitator superfamily 1 [Caulobacter sp.]
MGKFLIERNKLAAFWLGCAAVTAGVLLHLPMFLMARDMGYQLAGMEMDNGMLAGMGLIVLGIALTAYGLLPSAAIRHNDPHLKMSPSEEAPLTSAHWQLMAVLVVALVVDVMKPASLGFVVPGMRAEYGVSKAFVAWLPFTALLGTFVGSIVWGVLADIYGRRASILLSAIMFVGTSICGAMPSFNWNVIMCFLMGAAAGGLLPVAYALLAEAMPSKHRGWSLVMVGGLGAAGGYLAASSLSAVLQPLFGWRIMWFLNMPTGLLLIAMSGIIPESAKFLMQSGRVAEARAILKRFGSVLVPVTEATIARAAIETTGAHVARKSVILSIVGVTWSLINFGILLWLPADLVAKGASIGLTSKLLAQSALIALPAVLLAALLYSRWSTKGALAAMMTVSGLGLLGLILMDTPIAGVTLGPVLPVALLIFGSNGMLAVLLPYTAELFPLRVRGRATGLVAGCTKFGGLIAQGLGLLALIPALSVAAWSVVALLAVCVALISLYGEETRGRDLRDIDGEPLGLPAEA